MKERPWIFDHARRAAAIRGALLVVAVTAVGACRSAPASAPASQASTEGQTPTAQSPASQQGATTPASTTASPPSAVQASGPAPASATSVPEVSFPRRVPFLASVVIPSLSEPQPSPKVAAVSPSPPTPAPAPPAPPAVSPEPPSAPAQSAAKPNPSPAAPKAATPAPAPKPKAATAPPAKVEPVVKPTLPLAPPSSEEVVSPAADSSPAISRKVSALVGEHIEIPFDGSGWTYLGEKDGKDGVAYETRRFEGSGVIFVMAAGKIGDYVLRFQRQDALRGLMATELIGVNVRSKPTVTVPPQSPAASTGPAASTTPTAAAGPAAAAGGQSAPGAGAAGGAAVSPAQPSGTSASPGAATPGSASSPDAASAAASSTMPAPLPDPNSPEGMLLAAKNELGAGRIQSAIDQLDRLLARYPAGSDDVFYTYALALEQNGPLKDIRRAYSYYKKVCDEYPDSQLWDKANERVSYIERHYFEIR